MSRILRAGVNVLASRASAKFHPQRGFAVNTVGTRLISKKSSSNVVVNTPHVRWTECMTGRRYVMGANACRGN